MTGGVESYSWAVSQAFSRICGRVTLITASTDRRLPDEASRVSKIICLRGDSQLALLVRFVMQLLCRRIKGDKFDVIHATTWRMAIPAVLAFPRSKLVITVHGNEILVPSLLLKMLMDWVMKKANLLVCVSRHTESLLRETVPSLDTRTLVNYNGVSNSKSIQDIEEKWSQLDQRLTTFTVCRHESRKNLLSAIEGFIASGIEGEYRIAGSGPETDKLKELIAKHPNANVTLLGRISESQLKDEFLNASIFLHPQIEMRSSGDVEGFGLVVADAMAQGCVVIAGANGGTKELINHRVTGLSLKTCGSDEIAHQLSWCVANGDQLDSIGIEAHRRATQDFNWDSHVANIISVLQ